MSPRRSKTPPSPSRIRENVRALTAADLSKLIAELAFSTKLEQAVLAMARQETKRRKRLVEKAAQ